MAVLVIYGLIVLMVAAAIKLNEEKFTNRMVNEDEGDSFVEKQVVFSLFWPLILFVLIVISPFFVVMGLNKLIDKINKK